MPITMKSSVLALLSLLPLAGAVSIKGNIARELLEKARSLENNNNNADYSFLAGYSLKFQGCHHVQQWNDEADEDNDVRIKTKRLARFRICPSDTCSEEKSTGCTSKYGDYVVDLNNFVASYLQAMEEEKENVCAYYQEICQQDCGDDNCLIACYEEKGVDYCLDDDQDENEFDIEQYTECAEFDMPNNNNNNGGRRLEEEEVKYYIGPYCADQGGEIQLGLFTDDTCTTFAQYGESMFSNAMGFDLPYSSSSMISSYCMSCVNEGDDGSYEVREQCGDIYALSGKCETRMEIDYPNESSCSYIEGIKIIREDGVIRTSQTRKSKSAAVAIGVFMTLAVLLAAYVYYLRTKLSRAQINLAAASQPLT